MSKPWVVHDEARAELVASARWYEDEAEIGDDFIAVVEAGSTAERMYSESRRWLLNPTPN